MTGDSFEQVKRLMKIIGGKAIIVENDKPSFVVINVDEFLDFEDTKSKVGSEFELIDKINRDITVWKTKQKEKELKQMEKELSKKDREIEIVPNNTDI